MTIWPADHHFGRRRPTQHIGISGKGKGPAFHIRATGQPREPCNFRIIGGAPQYAAHGFFETCFGQDHLFTIIGLSRSASNIVILKNRQVTARIWDPFSKPSVTCPLSLPNPEKIVLMIRASLSTDRRCGIATSMSGLQ